MKKHHVQWTKELDLRILEAIYFGKYYSNAKNLVDLARNSEVEIQTLLNRAYFLRKKLGTYNPEDLSKHTFRYTPKECSTIQKPITTVKVVGENLIEVSKKENTSTVKGNKTGSPLSILAMIMSVLSMILFGICAKCDSMLLHFIGSVLVGISAYFIVALFDFHIKNKNDKKSI